MSSDELKNASREDLVKYLESWGYACYDHESTEELRLAALLNHKEEDNEASKSKAVEG